MNKIVMNAPWITQLERDYVQQAMEDCYWEGNWKWNEDFRKELGEYVGRKHCITTPSCTTAIHLLLSGLGMGHGDEVVVPNLTWIATAAPAHHLGVKIVFADVDAKTWCITPESIVKSITENTKAVIVVGLYSNMPDMDKIEEICKKHNIHLIEDAAQSIGSSYKGKKAGRFGIGSVFSFHRTKTLTTGEGGALLVDDDALYEKCMSLRDHGKHPTKQYWMERIGYKYMPSNVLSAIGLAQLRRIDQLVERKVWEFNQYQKYLDLPDIQWNTTPPDGSHGYWMTTIVVGKSYDVDKHYIIAELEKRGIPSRPFFYPLTSLPAVNKNSLLHEDTRKEIWPVSYDVSSRGISLPSSHKLTVNDIRFICESMKEILGV